MKMHIIYLKAFTKFDLGGSGWLNVWRESFKKLGQAVLQWDRVIEFRDF